VRILGSRAVRVVVVALVAAALIPVLGVDPAFLAVLLDADFLFLAGVVGLTMLGLDVRVLGSRIARSLPVLWVGSRRKWVRSDRGAREGS
jgi:hypothetical protein